jgi:hypothetical protein
MGYPANDKYKRRNALRQTNVLVWESLRTSYPPNDVEVYGRETQQGAGRTAPLWTEKEVIPTLEELGIGIYSFGLPVEAVAVADDLAISANSFCAASTSCGLLARCR